MFEKISVWFGAVGLVNTDVRRAAIDAGALPLLITTLQNSIAIFGMKALGGNNVGGAVEGGAKGAPPAKGKPAGTDRKSFYHQPLYHQPLFARPICIYLA